MLAVKQNLSLTIIYVVLYKPNDTADFFLFMVFVVYNIYIIEREIKLYLSRQKVSLQEKCQNHINFFIGFLTSLLG